MHENEAFIDDPAASRFELRIGDELVGWVEYRPAGESVILAHTETVDGHGGQGIGGRLVELSMQEFERRGLLVMPTCPFALDYLRHHPELQHLVDPSMRAQVRG